MIIIPYTDLSDQVCPRCNELETPVHALHDCHYARAIWSSFLGQLITSYFFQLELYSWCKNNSRLYSPLGYVPWNIIFAFTLWAILLGRNSLIFLGTFIPYHTLKHNAILHATKFFFLSNVHVGHLAALSIKYIRWRPAPSPYVTTNTYGSSLGNPGNSGAGGMARSAIGDWLWGFSLHLGVTNNTMVELWDIREALAQAWAMGHH